MDLQVVLLCPKTMAINMYYKTKLQVHNFTLFNLYFKKEHCYIWNKTVGDMRSEVFAYLQYHHFETITSGNPELQKLVILSDGYGYQNRNLNVRCQCLFCFCPKTWYQHHSEVFRRRPHANGMWLHSQVHWTENSEWYLHRVRLCITHPVCEDQTVTIFS